MVTPSPVSRGDIFLVDLEPTRGQEIRKMRPCLVVSPDELNRHVPTFIVALLTTGSHPYPFRVACNFQGRHGHIVLDQIRTVDRDRLVRRLGAPPQNILKECLTVLQEMFAP